MPDWFLNKYIRMKYYCNTKSATIPPDAKLYSDSSFDTVIGCFNRFTIYILLWDMDEETTLVIHFILEEFTRRVKKKYA